MDNMSRQQLRILFMGTPAFAVPSLRTLIERGFDVAAVVTQADKPKGRGRKLTAPPVKELAMTKGIPVLQPASIRKQEFLDQVAAINPDLIVVAAYGKILPGALLHLPPHGTINVHGSLLPKYRGAAPIQRAIINGEQETGITIMQMDEGMDTGDILLTGALPIESSDTSATLGEKMAHLGARLLADALDLLLQNKLVAQKQDDTLATMAPPLTKEDGHIDWRNNADHIACLIRGLDPWPSAFTFLDGQRLRLFAPQVVASETPAPAGSICQADNSGLMIATGKGMVRIGEVQLEGSRRMPAESFLRGRPLTGGIVLK